MKGPAGKHVYGIEVSHAADRHRQVLQPRKGFGFITPEGGEKDVFVHISAVQASGLPGLEHGQKVSFDTEPDKRGKVRRRSISLCPEPATPAALAACVFQKAPRRARPGTRLVPTRKPATGARSAAVHRRRPILLAMTGTLLLARAGARRRR